MIIIMCILIEYRPLIQVSNDNFCTGEFTLFFPSFFNKHLQLSSGFGSHSCKSNVNMTCVRYSCTVEIFATDCISQGAGYERKYLTFSERSALRHSLGLKYLSYERIVIHGADKEFDNIITLPNERGISGVCESQLLRVSLRYLACATPIRCELR